MATRRRGTILFRAEVEGAGPLARDFDRAARELQNELLRELRRIGARGLARMVEAAPRDSGDLIEQLDLVYYSRAARPRVTFVAPTRPGHPGAEDGYPYVAVTRFGHRRDEISAKPEGILSVHGAGRDYIGSYRRTVRAYHPDIDWVDEAARGIDREVSASEARIGRSITTSLGGGRLR